MQVRKAEGEFLVYETRTALAILFAFCRNWEAHPGACAAVRVAFFARRSDRTAPGTVRRLSAAPNRRLFGRQSLFANRLGTRHAFPLRPVSDRCELSRLPWLRNRRPETAGYNAHLRFGRVLHLRLERRAFTRGSLAGSVGNKTSRGTSGPADRGHQRRRAGIHVD